MRQCPNCTSIYLTQLAEDKVECQNCGAEFIYISAEDEWVSADDVTRCPNCGEYDHSDNFVTPPWANQDDTEKVCISCAELAGEGK